MTPRWSGRPSTAPRPRDRTSRDRAPRPRVSGDTGSGTPLAVAVLAACVITGSAAVALAGGLATRQSVIAAADAAALAAADTALGVVPGEPCRAAERLAAAHGAGLAACRVEGLVVTVVTTRTVLGVAVTATARAGPP